MACNRSKKSATLNSKFEKNSGFTMPEILVGLGIIGLIALLVATIFFAYFRLFSNQNTAIDLTSQNKLAIDEITNQIRQSQAVAANCCDGDTSDSNNLVLQLWPLDATGEPFDPGVTPHDYLVYRREPVNNTNLIKKTVPNVSSSRTGGTKIIASNVSDLQFTYDDPTPSLAGEVTVLISTTGTSGNKTQTVTQTTKAILRNK